MARRRLKLRYRLAFLALVAGGFGLAAVGPVREAMEQHRAIEAEGKKLSALKSTNEKLEKDLQRLNDDEYLEKAAREQLGLVRPGETSFIVERPPARARPKPPPGPPPPWYREIWNRLRSVLR